MSLSKRRLRSLTLYTLAFGSALVAGGLALNPSRAHAAELDRAVPLPGPDEAVPATQPETLILAGGCFWGIQGVFQHVRGVEQAVSGYGGGMAATAQYETVSTGTTGHAESVRIAYDPRMITHGQLLRIYFSVATDPTQVNQQFSDSGTQYRSEIFATTPAQAKIASAYIPGNGVINGQRLNQLVRQHEAVANRTFEIQFLDPGATAYSFTFG